MRKLLGKESGFTLVELMVVVAIIGILSAVAIPNFKKYQAKSKTSEAKLQLSAVYTAMQSWYSDYDNYADCLNLMGYDPALERLSRFYVVGFTAGATPAGNTSSVTNGAPTACSAAVSIVNDATTASASNVSVSVYGAGRMVGGTAALLGATMTTTNVPSLVVPTATAFAAGALGIIDASKATAATADAWTINQDKRIIQNRTGY